MDEDAAGVTHGEGHTTSANGPILASGATNPISPKPVIATNTALGGSEKDGSAEVPSSNKADFDEEERLSLVYSSPRMSFSKVV